MLRMLEVERGRAVRRRKDNRCSPSGQESSARSALKSAREVKGSLRDVALLLVHPWFVLRQSQPQPSRLFWRRPGSLLSNPTPGEGETEIEGGVVENAMVERRVVA